MAKFKTRKQYRLTFANENTFNAVWTLRLSRAKVWTLTAVCVAAIAALVVVVVVWTPVSSLLPGYLKPSQRQTNVENVMRIDSLIEKTENQQLYIDNMIAIINAQADTVTHDQTEVSEIRDTLMTATENEREFVERWSERHRD